MDTIFNKPRLSERALFNPHDVIDRIEGFPEICVSTFAENIIQKFSSLDSVQKIADLYTVNGYTPVYKINYSGTDIAFYQSRVGAPACVAGFEEIVAMGAKKFVLFGCCGVLDDAAVEGRIIVPTSAVRDEGTSYHYQEPSFEIESESRSIQVLEKALEKCCYPYIKGKTWTTDAIYRETLHTIQVRKSEGCIAVEMECASMLAVSRYRNIPFIQFLYGADNIGSESWEVRDLGLPEVANAEKYMLLAFECGVLL